MSSNFQKNTSKIVIYTFIFILVGAFAISGMQFGGAVGGALGKVGDYRIEIREYQNQLNFLINQYKRFTRKEFLSSKQIEQFGLKSQALNSLINQKLMMTLGDKLGYIPSDTALNKKIKTLPYFQNKDKKFDVNLYKALLNANSYTTKDFENSQRDEMKSDAASKILNNIQLSKGFLGQLVNFKNQKITVSAIQFKKRQLKEHIPVDKKEVKAFLNDQKNQSKLQTIFTSRKPSLDQKEQVNAKHILIKLDPKNEQKALKEINEIAKKVNPSNFEKMANKFTQDPTGKGKGGSLGWFTRGRMVPEFEKVAFELKPGTISAPVKTAFGHHIIYVVDKKKAKLAKFEDHKFSIAEDLLRDSKTKDLETLVKVKTSEFEQALKQNNKSKLDKLKRKYNFILVQSKAISRLDDSVGSVQVNPESFVKLFNTGENFHTIKDSDRITLIYKTKQLSSNADVKLAENLKKERNSQKYFYQSKFQEDLISDLRQNVSLSVPDPKQL